MMLQVYGKCHFLFLYRSIFGEKREKLSLFSSGTLFRALSTRSALPFCPLNALVLIICSMQRAHQHTQTPTRALHQQKGKTFGRTVASGALFLVLFLPLAATQQ